MFIKDSKKLHGPFNIIKEARYKNSKVDQVVATNAVETADKFQIHKLQLKPAELWNETIEVTIYTNDKPKCGVFRERVFFTDVALFNRYGPFDVTKVIEYADNTKEWVSLISDQ